MKKKAVTINGNIITPVYRSTFLYMDDDHINHYREDFHHWEDAEARRLHQLAGRYSLPIRIGDELLPGYTAQDEVNRKNLARMHQSFTEARYEYLARLVEAGE